MIIPHNGDTVALRNDEVLLPTDAAAELTRSVEEICSRLVYYASCSGNSLPTFRDTLSFPSSTAKKSV